MSIIKHLVDAAQGKHPLGTARSGKWPTVRKNYLALHPVCEVCGGKEKLEVHHKKVFHLNPQLELDPNNLITLCESGANGINCHLAVGHLGNFKSFNPSVEADAKIIRARIQNRPTATKE